MAHTPASGPDHARVHTASCDFVLYQRYRRRDLHAHWGGQSQGGISTPKHAPVIFLFTGAAGEAHGYQDGWRDGVFHYTGEGQFGDMAFVRGNRAIRDHLRDGRDLHLFAQADRGYVTYLGVMVCIGWQEQLAPDTAGRLRQVIVFELVPLGALASAPAGEAAPATADPLTLLRAQALADAAPAVTAQERLRHYRARSQAIVRYAVARADGVCEGCGQPAPFVTADGRPYLEVHHLLRLADDGPDHPERVAALCPTCHRRVHHAADGAAYNAQVQQAITAKEADIGGREMARDGVARWS